MRSGRPGWCRKNPPFSEAPCPVILKSTISYPTLLSSSPYRQHTKTLCSQYGVKTKQMCRNVCIWSSGECNGWQVSRHKPLDTKPLPFREIGQQEDLLANLMQHIFTYSWFEMTWNYPTCGKFSYLTFVFYCFSTLVIN